MAIKTSKFMILFMFVLLIAVFSQRLSGDKDKDQTPIHEIQQYTAESAVLLGLAKLRVDSFYKPALRQENKQ